MDLFCEKYRIKISREGAVCTHLEEYCKFREACIINFMTRERQREERRNEEAADQCPADDTGNRKDADK